MSFLKLLFSFAPWIAFLIIARDTLPEAVNLNEAPSSGIY